MQIKRILTFIVLIIVLLLGITFASINANTVTFDFYFNSTEISLSLLLAYTLGIGILLGFISPTFSILKLKNCVRKLKSQLKIAEKNALTESQTKHKNAQAAMDEQ
jgi:putative membrane protein